MLESTDFISIYPTWDYSFQHGVLDIEQQRS